MTETEAGTREARERRLRRIWLLRQLHGVVLLGVLVGLLLLARARGLEGLARGVVYCLFAWPIFAVAIAWWDRHWVWKHQDRLIGPFVQGPRP